MMLQNIISSLVWFTIGYNISSVISHSILTRHLRTKLLVSKRGTLKFFGEFLNCVWCVSTWVFFALSYVLYNPILFVFYHIDSTMSIFYAGMFGSFCTYLYSRLEKKL